MDETTTIKKPRQQTREWKDWQPKEFQPTLCTDLILLMAKGKGPQAFNAINNISRATFYRWLEEFPDFKLAYEVGKQKCDAYLLDLLHEYKIEAKADGTCTLNVSIFKEIEKAARRSPERREAAMVVKGDTPKTMMTSVLQALGQGMIGLEEATEYAQLIELSQRVGETSELMQKVEELERALSGGATKDEFVEEK